jgi:adenylate cyclase
MAMTHYRNKEWDEAISHFSESLKLERFPKGKITPSGFFLKRCQEFKENPPVPPDEKCDGVYRMTEK